MKALWIALTIIILSMQGYRNYKPNEYPPVEPAIFQDLTNLFKIGSIHRGDQAGAVEERAIENGKSPAGLAWLGHSGPEPLVMAKVNLEHLAGKSCR